MTTAKKMTKYVINDNKKTKTTTRMTTMTTTKETKNNNSNTNKKAMELTARTTIQKND